MNNAKNKDFYIYNLKQAEYFIKGGLVPNKIGTHRATKRVFFQFARNEELENILVSWIQRVVRSS